MLLLSLFYNKMTLEVKNSLASPRRCTFSGCLWKYVCKCIIIGCFIMINVKNCSLYTS